MPSFPFDKPKRLEMTDIVGAEWSDQKAAIK
jgi:hypothetical protein